MSEPWMVTARVLVRLARVATARDATLQPWLADVGLDADVVADPTRPLPLDAVCAVLHLAAQQLDDPWLGLSMAAASTPSDYGLFGYVFHHASTLAEGVSIVTADIPASVRVLDLAASWTPHGLRLGITFPVDHLGVDVLVHEHLAALHRWAHAGRRDETLAVHLRAAGQGAALRATFGVTPTMGADEDAILLSRTAARRVRPSADPALMRHLLEAAATQASRRRRAAGGAGTRLRLAACTVDLVTGTVRRDGQTASLTTKERTLLQALARAPGGFLSREAVERDVWGLHPEVRSFAPDVAVRRLRRKLEADPARPVSLLTEHGQGWRLVLLPGSGHR